MAVFIVAFQGERDQVCQVSPMDNLLSFSTLDTAGDVNISFLLKFFRLARGTANELDDRIRARGNAASMIEVPLERNATQKDVYVENEELKASTYS